MKEFSFKPSVNIRESFFETIVLMKQKKNVSLINMEKNITKKQEKNKRHR